MSKILKNTTGSPITITDTGVTIPASPGQYTIPAQDYLLWAASDNVVGPIGSGDLVVNDGSVDLGISDGTDLIKGIYPKKFGVLAGSDYGAIGRVNDQLKVRDADAITVLNSINTALGGSGSIGIFRRNEVSITTRNETDLPTVTYTVPAGKKFILTSIAASYDASAAMYVRLKKQVGGTGPWTTEMRLTMMAGGQGEATESISIPTGVQIANAGDIIKITYESSLSRGTLWAEFSGSEV